MSVFGVNRRLDVGEHVRSARVFQTFVLGSVVPVVNAIVLAVD